MDNNEKADKLLNELFIGNLSPAEITELEEYEANNPEFKEFKTTLELLWGLKEGLTTIREENVQIAAEPEEINPERHSKNMQPSYNSSACSPANNEEIFTSNTKAETIFPLESQTQISSLDSSTTKNTISGSTPQTLKNIQATQETNIEQPLSSEPSSPKTNNTNSNLNALSFINNIASNWTLPPHPGNPPTKKKNNTSDICAPSIPLHILNNIAQSWAIPVQPEKAAKK